MFRPASLCAAIFAALVFCCVPASAEDYSAHPLNIPDAASLNSFGSQATLVDDPGVPGGKALHVVAAKSANSWDAAVLSQLRQPVKAGDRLVFAFWARLVSGEAGATSATLPWNSVSLGSAPWTQLFGAPVTIGPQWKRYEIRGTADKDYPAGALNASVQVANANQTIDFGPMYVAKSTDSPVAQAAAPTAPASILATLDPDTLASKIVNDPGAPAVNGARGSLVADSRVMGGKALRVQVPGKGKNTWDISVASPVKKAIKAGDQLLLLFPARLEKGENGATATTLPWNSVGMTSPPWSGVIGGSGEIGPDWKTIEINGKADKDYPAGSLAVSIQLATARQTVDLGPIVVLDLGQ